LRFSKAIYLGETSISAGFYEETPHF
jgi:hypothetical protein